MYISSTYHAQPGALAKTMHQDDASCLHLGEQNIYGGLYIYGPASAKKAFDKIAKIYNAALQVKP